MCLLIGGVWEIVFSVRLFINYSWFNWSLYQVRIKRLLAYTSMVHMGYMLLTLSFGGSFAVILAINYLIIYIIMSLLMFASIIFLRRLTDNREFDIIHDFQVLREGSPLYALFMVFILFSMVGLHLWQVF